MSSTRAAPITRRCGLTSCASRHTLAAVIAKRGQLSCVEKNVGLIGVMVFFVLTQRFVPKSTRGTS